MPRAWGNRVGATVAVLATVAAVAGATVLWVGRAFACTNLATISLSAGFGHAGDTITLIGTSFPVPHPASAALPTPVVVRWRSIDGPIVATAVPDRTGTISATFTVPPSEPGNAVVVAVQRRPAVDTAPAAPGAPGASDAPPPAYVDEPGTPARATFRILAPGELASASLPFGTVLTTGEGDSGSTALTVMLVLFGTVALSLFAGGVMAFLHQLRSQRPAPQAWPPY